MPTPAARRTIAIHDPVAYGDMTLAPALMTGRSESELARAMAETIDPARQSASDALRELRKTYPDMPLAMRVAALEASRRR